MGLYHQITGSGPTVVLIHGVCHRTHAWDPVVPLLADRFRVVTVDLPGHGQSADLPDEGDVLEHTVGELIDLLETVIPDGERPHIAGNSLGGFLALELGARGYASSVTALSLPGSSARMPNGATPSPCSAACSARPANSAATSRC